MPGNGAVGASYGDLLVTSLVVLGGVCIAAFAIVRLAGRWFATGRSRGAQLLDVVARLPLEPRRSLYVVEVAGKTLLVGTSEMGLSVLSELDGGELRARVAERPSFGELVRSAWQRRRPVSHKAVAEHDRQAGAHRRPPDLDRQERPSSSEPGAAAGLRGGEVREAREAGGFHEVSEAHEARGSHESHEARGSHKAHEAGGSH